MIITTTTSALPAALTILCWRARVRVCVCVWWTGPGPRASSARLKDGTNLESGDFFGTQALDDLKGNPPKRRVTGVAATAVDVYKMSRQAALQLGDLPELIINNSRVKAIRNLEWFTGLPRADRLAAAKSLPSYGYARDEPIVVRDAIGGQGMYVIIEGTVGVTGGDKDETLGEGDFFLAESLTTRAAAAPATYTSNGGVSCVVVDRTRLRELVEFREEESKEEQAPIALSDLKLVATLGVGGFGRVKMVRRARVITTTTPPGGRLLVIHTQT